LVWFCLRRLRRRGVGGVLPLMVCRSVCKRGARAARSCLLSSAPALLLLDMVLRSYPSLRPLLHDPLSHSSRLKLLRRVSGLCRSVAATGGCVLAWGTLRDMSSSSSSSSSVGSFFLLFFFISFVLSFAAVTRDLPFGVLPPAIFGSDSVSESRTCAGVVLRFWCAGLCHSLCSALVNVGAT